MELTVEQINRIEKYLDYKKIDYVDFRHEILDHMSTDIEHIMISNNDDFDTAFNHTIKKWNGQLQRTSSLIFGLAFQAPKLVINRAIRIFKPFYIITFIIGILGVPIFHFSNIQISDKTVTFLVFNFKLITIFLSVIWVFIFLKIRHYKRKTVHSFIIKTQAIGVVSVPIILIYNYSDFFVNGLALIMFLSFLYNSIVSIYFLKKHLQEIKKYGID